MAADLYFVRMPEEFREPDILKKLPALLDEPRTYLSVAQASSNIKKKTT
jgi:hypothetical protein